MPKSPVGSIAKRGDYWVINYLLTNEAFVESDNSSIIEDTEQYGFVTMNLTGTLNVNVDKVLADGNVEVEGLRLTEALYHLAAQADGDAKRVYNELALIIDNDEPLYRLCQKLEAGE